MIFQLTDNSGLPFVLVLFWVEVNELRAESPVTDERNCDNLRDFVAWDNARQVEKRILIGENQTTIGANYTAWQMEQTTQDKFVTT